MKTVVTNFNDDKLLQELLNNQVIGFPTETVYGLGVIYNSEVAFSNLVKAKHRTPDKPFTLMVGDKKDIEKYAIIDKKIKMIIDRFFPGELTLLLKPKEELYPWVTLNSKYIGIRVPDSKEVCEMINKLGYPLLVSSANISNEPVCNNFEEVYEKFNNRIALIVKGKTKSSIPSTIVICDEELTLIREGNLPFKIIKEEWEKR